MGGISTSRGHRFKVRERTFNRKLRGRFLFTQRLIDVWNSLQEKVGRSSTITMFKIQLDRHLNSHGIDSYVWSNGISVDGQKGRDGHGGLKGPPLLYEELRVPCNQAPVDSLLTCTIKGY